MSEMYESEVGATPDWLLAWDIPSAVKMLAETAVYSQLVLMTREVTSAREGPSAEQLGLVTNVPHPAERAEVTKRLTERHSHLLADLSLQHSLPDDRSWGDEIREQTLAVFLPEAAQV